jgi:hypothetical protein
MKPALYSNGDSVTWGAELKNKETERFSSLISNHLEMHDCNNASSGVSNDYIYRQTLRDVLHWLKYKKVWCEELGWINTTKLFVLIGWTAPTRFERWDTNQYIQDRLWVDYDKWGSFDADKKTNISFVFNQTMDIPSYIRTFNHIISLSSILKLNNIPYYFFNTFYEYKKIKEIKTPIDKFGKTESQADLNTLWDFLPHSMKDKTMFSYIQQNGGDFLQRNHPSLKSHKLWADYLTTYINI